MVLPDSNSTNVEYFMHPHRSTCPPTCSGARLWAWLSPRPTPSPGSHKGNFAPLFTGPPASSNFPSLHSPSLKHSLLLFFSIAGPGATSTPVLRCSFHLNPGYSTINASLRRPIGTPIGQPDSTRRGGRTSPFAWLPKCSTWRVSLQGPAGTTNDFCMNATGR